MKHSILFILILLIAVPMFGQDDGGGSFGGGFDGGGGAFEAGGRFDPGGGFDGATFDESGPDAVIQRVVKSDPLSDLRSWLNRASAKPIEKNQAKLLKSLYNRQIKEMAKSFQKQFGVSLDAAISAQSVSRGRRGGVAKPADTALTTAIARLQNQLNDKIIAALRMDQQAALRKYQSEELRINEVRLLDQKLKAAGIILSPEQKSKVDEAYARKSYLRTFVIIEAKGEPYDETMALLSKQTTQRVVQALNSTQIAALSSVNKSKLPQPSQSQ